MWTVPGFAEPWVSGRDLGSGLHLRGTRSSYRRVINIETPCETNKHAEPKNFRYHSAEDAEPEGLCVFQYSGRQTTSNFPSTSDCGDAILVHSPIHIFFIGAIYESRNVPQKHPRTDSPHIGIP